MHLLLDASTFGFLGVDVFFALSGFLITRILLRQRTRPTRYYSHFYARRLLRLAPPYLLTLAIVAVATHGVSRYLLLSLVYLANFAAILHVPVTYGVLWSLAVEEHFYFIWPWLVRRHVPAILFRISMAVCLLSPVLRIVAIHFGHFDTYASWFRFDGLAWGALLALLCLDADFRSRRWARALLGFAAAGALLGLTALVLWVRVDKDLGDAVFYTAVPLCTVALIGFALGQPKRLLAPLRWAPARFFGDLSYWIYLIHILFVYQIASLFERDFPAFAARGGLALWLAVAAAVLGCSVLSGVLVRRGIELPALRLKGRFR